MVEQRRKYIHNKRKTEVYVVGRVEYIPEGIPLVIFVTLKDGKAKAAKEELFLRAYNLDE